MSKKYQFQIYDYLESHEHNTVASDESPDMEEDIGVYTINLFGRTLDDKSVYVKVQEFTPYFYVKIPDKWKTKKIDYFVDHIKSKVWGKYKNGLINYDVV